MSFDIPSDEPDEAEQRDIRNEQERRAQTEPKGQRADAGPGVFISPAELAASTRGSEWLVEGYVECNTLATLYGESGTFKSAIAIDLGMHVATGRDFYGRRVQQGAVFYIAGEGHAGVARRGKAWLVAHSVEGLPPMFVTKRAVPLDDDGEADKIANEIERHARKTGQRVAMIVVDTLNWNMAGDENLSRDMSKFLRAVDSLKSRFGACVLVVHHTGHGSKDRERGSTALPGGVDARYLVTRKSAEMFATVQAKKMKDGSEPAPLRFGVRAIDIGIADNFGNKQTAIAITSAVATTVERKQSDAKVKVKEAHSDFLRCLDSVGKPSSLPDWVPADAVVAAAKDVRTRFDSVYKGGEIPSDPDEARKHDDSCRRAFSRARSELRDTGQIDYRDGYVWRIPDSARRKAA